MTGGKPSTFGVASPASWLSWLTLALLSGFALWGAAGVPFHPDESTQLFMSRDFESLFTRPGELLWRPDNAADLRTRYRTLDPPLTRYWLGLARLVAGQPALPVDWDWSRSWEDNQQAGALPSASLLLAGRLAVTLCLPFSLWLVWRTGAALGGELTGWLALILLGLNALVLLHGRRAMAEGALLLGVCLALWSFLHADRRPWLAGLAVAIAFNAKYSTFPLVGIGLLAVLWPVTGTFNGRRMLSNALVYLAVFGLVTLALNPFLWGNPPAALQAAWNNRQDLLARQVADTARLAPDQLLDTPGQRLLALLVNLYLAGPAFAEVGNYLAQTAAVEGAYLANPLHSVLRGLLPGGLLFALGLAGMAILALRFGRGAREKSRAQLLVWLATLAQAAGLLLTVPLPWQRYVIPLVPFTCLWASAALGSLSQPVLKGQEPRKTQQHPGGTP